MGSIHYFMPHDATQGRSYGTGQGHFSFKKSAKVGGNLENQKTNVRICVYADMKMEGNPYDASVF
jgi:hypothetical protein